MNVDSSLLTVLRKAYRGAVLRQRRVTELLNQAASCKLWVPRELLIQDRLRRLECDDDYSQDYASMAEEFDAQAKTETRGDTVYYALHPFLRGTDDSLLSAVRQSTHRMFVTTDFDLEMLSIPESMGELPVHVSPLELEFIVNAYKSKLSTLLTAFRELSTSLNYYVSDVLKETRPLAIDGELLEYSPEFRLVFEQLQKTVALPFTRPPAPHFSSESNAINTVRNPLNEPSVLTLLAEELA